MDSCELSEVTLIIADAYGFAGDIAIELANEMNLVSEVTLDVCDVDQRFWLHIATDSCSVTGRAAGFTCTISDLGNGCVRVAIASPGSELIDSGEAGAIALLHYTLDANAPLGEYADLNPANVTVRDEAGGLLTVTPKPGRVGAEVMDTDGDGTPDQLDNCPAVYNAGQEDDDEDGRGDECDNCPALSNPLQEDSYPPQGNECGDACECEGNFDGDKDVDGTDASFFKSDFGRSKIQNPCTDVDLCNGDFSCDEDVDGTDASLFKKDFGRSSILNPCPSCVTEDWCSYPE
jgi:hypothetical protein